MNIVVANSVGVDSNGFRIVHVPSRWSLGVKNFTNCGYYPWQLAYTSSLLKRETPHHVKMLDGVLHGWDFATYFQHLAEEKPEWLVMESSSRTIKEDLRLAAAAKEAFGTKLIFTGQHPMARPEDVLQVADHVCIGEYEYAVLDLIRGKDPKTISGAHPNPRAELLDVDSLPFPEDEDVRRIDYHEPNCRYRQIQMYASRGCPRRCNFCAAATLYYDELNWRPRNVDSVIAEIRALKEKYPEMEGVFFDEETHNIRKSFNIALARAIRQAGLDGLKYEAMCEYASLDVEAMTEMAKAGYYKIRVGVETASERVAEAMTLGKKFNPGKLQNMLRAGKDLGLQFYGTFSVGGLRSNPDEDQKTVDLIDDLSRQGLMDEVQVSINTPQPGTDFYRTAMARGWIRQGLDWDDFDGNGHVVVEYPDYSAEQIKTSFDRALAAFDRGKENAGAETFRTAARQSFRARLPSGRVLVLRCVRPWMIHLVLDALGENPNIRADILGQDAAQAELRGHPRLNKYYSYGQGFFQPQEIGKNLLQELRANRYDALLLPMANNHIDGYKNVLETARSIHANALFGVTWDGKLLPLQ
jgi:radical SAM superfamily enzyme YgiQ (UPF0313 family)